MNKSIHNQSADFWLGQMALGYRWVLYTLGHGDLAEGRIISRHKSKAQANRNISDFKKMNLRILSIEEHIK